MVCNVGETGLGAVLYVTDGAVVGKILGIVAVNVTGLMACRALKRALFPVGQGIPDLGLTSGQRVLI